MGFVMTYVDYLTAIRVSGDTYKGVSYNSDRGCWELTNLNNGKLVKAGFQSQPEALKFAYSYKLNLLGSLKEHGGLTFEQWKAKKRNPKSKSGFKGISFYADYDEYRVLDGREVVGKFYDLEDALMAAYEWGL